jgi:hypothetical protein
VIDFWIAFSNVVSSWGGLSEKLGLVTAGRAVLIVARDLLAQPVSGFSGSRTKPHNQKQSDHRPQN